MTGILIKRGNLDPQRDTKDAHTHTHKEKNIIAHGEDSHPSSQRERAQKERKLPTSWSETSSFQNWEKFNFGCLNHPVCGILLWHL